MKAISPEALQSILDSELVWRRREISALVAMAKSSEQSSNTMAIVRASVPLLYAHWEGFGKECIVRYLEYVSYRRIKFKNLTPSFLYLSSLPSLSGISDLPVREGIERIRALLERTEQTNKDSFRKKVGTKSNLRSEVLSNLLSLCGLSDDDFVEYYGFIDREICDSRNEIAHGSNSAPSVDVFIERRDKAFAIMSHLQTTIVNGALTGSFKLIH